MEDEPASKTDHSISRTKVDIQNNVFVSPNVGTFVG